MRNNLGAVITFSLLLFATLLLVNSCHLTTKSEGELLYIKYCSNCHNNDGSGLARLMPPLRKSSFLAEHRDKIACLIRNGMDSAITVNGIPFKDKMPPHKNLSAIQITNIINYISNHFGNKLGYLELEDVQHHLDACAKDLIPEY